MHDLYIDGAWRPPLAGGTRDVVDPFDGRVVRTVAEGDADDARLAIAAARRAFDDGDWPWLPGVERGRCLDRLAAAITADREHLAALETQDTGKTLAESRMDIDDIAGVVRYYAALADKDAGEVVDAPTPGLSSVVHREPVGVCGQISPWNYPLLQASWKFAPALAAGNTIVVKPAELTPLTTIRVFELMDETGFPAGTVNLVLGDGATVGAELSASHDVDLVSFTGGIETGQRVMRAAAGNVKKIALELGGKNPNIVFADAEFETAVDYALLAVFLHAGQVCSAGARLLVEEAIHDRFVDAVVERAQRIRLGDGRDPATESGPLISAEHRAKVEAHVARAIAEGAELRCGGERPSDPALTDGFFYAPTVLTGCRPDMAIVQQEVFGPVLTVEAFADEQDAVTRANDTVYGLAGGVWTSDLARAQRVARRLRLGTVWINDFHPYFPQAPWGGYKRSGIGRELGREGLAEYVETKHVATNLAPQPTGWFGTGRGAGA
ncbi:aldehyde dehydrogenase family protein [Egicoccus sp. AB-alg6-2]|uniref:aldehyde dehydrogenase family protein n=1 Tax=Egicoccus sp. AB-alg6-2 TaxID=3242692 RepID=UPI00359DBACB